ncbi:MAG TPA: FtsX-like permease family protein, partial [Pyrinomonadaceae bacterium]
MNYPTLVFRNGLRNKRRTLLTVLSVGLALFVLTTLVTFVGETRRLVEQANPLRMLTRHSVSMMTPLPERYRAEIEKVPGVAAITPLYWFDAIYIDEAHSNFAMYSCDPRTLFDVHTNIKLPIDQRETFQRERTAAIVGRRTADKHGWKIGDRITLKGAKAAADLELTLRGIFTGTPTEEIFLFFHHDYLEEALGRPGMAGNYWIKAQSAEVVPRVMQMVDAMFENTDAPTKTETERAFSLGFISMLGNLNTLVAAVTGCVIFAILLMTANTMALSVRERVRELAVLKALGFRRRKVLGLVASEGALITLMGGIVGCGAALLFCIFSDLNSISRGLVQQLNVSWETIGLG